MGYGGVYFRQTLPNPGDQRIPAPIPTVQQSSIQFHDTDSGNISQIVDSTSAALLEEINSKSKKSLIWPWVLGAALCLCILLIASGSPIWLYCVLLPLCVIGLVGGIYADKLRKTVVLFYDLEPHLENAFQNLHNAFDLFGSCAQVWHVDSSGNITTTYDWKVNAGANTVVRRSSARPSAGQPPYFQCNIQVPVLTAGRRKLYFFPDRVLVWDTNGIGAIGFDQLEVMFHDQRFIEDGGVPSDSRVVGKTWKYVNKKGGPDRRFTNNRELPIVIYEGLLFTSRSGLQAIFQASRTGVGNVLNSALKQMTSAISQRTGPISSSAYIKCPCNNCDIFIEFPSEGVGQKIVCPHCGMETLLFDPAVNIGVR